ncbi:MAG: hypothetical protein EBX51_00435, partial [Acidimicrobiia bacterium]|nr:hypothetical protein [Acidimicrobiia bacterium]
MADVACSTNRDCRSTAHSVGLRDRSGLGTRDRSTSEKAGRCFVNLAELLRHDGVEEVSELRGTFGFMAFHGGALEERTDLIARAAAQEAQASYYGVHQPAGMRQHVPSHRFTADQSPRLAEFLA